MYHHKYTKFGGPFLYKYEDTFVKGQYPFNDEDRYSDYLLRIIYDYDIKKDRRVHQPVISSKLRYYMDHLELISILGKIYSKTTSYCRGKRSGILSSTINAQAIPTMQAGYVFCKTVKKDVYIPQTVVSNSNMFSDWNVIIKYINAHIDLRLQGELLPRNHTCSDSYIIVGSFGTQTEAQNMADYLNTKLIRLIVFINNIRDTCIATPITIKSINSIPFLNFTEHWDDKKLYDKYGLTTEEINYIETVIK